MKGKLKYIWANRGAYIRRYLWPLPKFKREIVVMIDGSQIHGGLTDRFRNILSIYYYCKEHSVPFKLYYVYPHKLEDILIPNNYDWRIAHKDISYHFLDSEEVFLDVQELPGIEELKSSISRQYNNENHLAILNNKLHSGRKIQYHVFGNAYFAKGQYATLFKSLFKPSAYLLDCLSNTTKNIIEAYESVSLRFQMLLGDFYEGEFEVLDERERDKLINKCIDKIDELWKNQFFSTSKVLVTSDSALFLKHIAAKEYVYTIPGKMEHMDYTHNSDLEMNAKPFLDLFLLMQSKRLSQLITGKMYKSGFPAFAAELGGRPYVEIVF